MIDLGTQPTLDDALSDLTRQTTVRALSRMRAIAGTLAGHWEPSQWVGRQLTAALIEEIETILALLEGQH